MRESVLFIGTRLSKLYTESLVFVIAHETWAVWNLRSILLWRSTFDVGPHSQISTGAWAPSTFRGYSASPVLCVPKRFVTM